jgi:beta-phosphoglucomutase
MNARAFDALIFDMDGVLCDSEPYWAAAVIEMLRRRYGLAVVREEFLPFVGAGDDRFISGSAELHGVTADLAIDRALAYDLYVEEIRGTMPPIRGVREFLSDARRAGLLLAVATGSGRPKLDANLAAIGVPERTFDVVVSAEQIARKKPDPETFQRAIDGLGIAAARCLVVEDARNGVLAGRAAGCEVLGVTSSMPASVLRAAGAFATAEDFTTVPDSVRRALGIS